MKKRKNRDASIVEMFDDGISQTIIAEKHGVCIRTVQRAIRRADEEYATVKELEQRIEQLEDTIKELTNGN